MRDKLPVVLEEFDLPSDSIKDNDNNNNNNSYGFINFVNIIYILSFLLSIGSVIVFLYKKLR